MGSNVRSVTVRLNAAVVGYIRDMNRAGDATEKAFDRVHTSTSRAREDFIAADRAAGQLSASTEKLGRSTRLASPSQRQLATDVDRVSVAAVRGSASIDKYSGRLRVLGELVAVLGPGVLALGGGGLAALAGLAGLFGGATVGALGLVVAVQGVGDALKAVEKARLDPTVANLQAAQEAMSKIAPEAREFVARFQELRPVLKALRDAGAEKFFPGLTDSLDSLERLAPTLERILAVSGRAGGDAIARSAASLTTDRWAPFFEFLTDEIPDAIDDASRLVGSLAHGATELWMAFDPTNDNFIDWLVDVGDGFDRWTSSADGREDIAEFLAYVEKTGPKVGDFIVAAADALTQMAQAAAPLSGPVLDGLTAVAKVVSAIADSDLGTPILTGVAALTLYTRGLQAAVALQTKLTGTGAAGAMGSGGVMGSTRAGVGGLKAVGRDLRVVGQNWRYLGTSAALAEAKQSKALGGMTKGAAVMGGLAVASTGVAEGIGLSNTASLALIGTIAGPWGAAVGAGVGVAIDFGTALGNAATAGEDLDRILQQAASAGSIEELQAASAALQKHYDDINGIEGAALFIGDKLGFNNAMDEARAAGEEKARIDAQIAEMSEDAARAQLGLSQSFEDTAEAAGMTTGELYELTSAIDAHTQAALGAFSAETQWRQAMVAATEQAKNSNAGINGNSDAALKNRGALQDLAGAWLNQRDAMVENGASADAIDRKFKRARDAFIQTATAMGVPITQARRLARQLIGLPDSKKIDVVLGGTESAIRALRIMRGELAGIKSKTVTVTINGKRIKGKLDDNADLGGGTIPGTADGGTVPGNRYPYRDSVLTYLAPTEEVITNRNGEADRFRADRAAGRIPAYASGGTVGYRGPVGYASGGTVRAANGHDPDNVAGGLRGMSRELRAAEKAIAAERKQRESLIGRRNTLKAGVREGLGEDIWRPGNDWASGGPNAGLRSNIAEIRAFDQLTGRLKKKGVKGGALDAILAQGDLATAQAYAGMSKSELAEYQRLYNVQRRELNRVSGNAGDAAYGAAIKESVRQERLAVAEIKHLRAAVNRGTKSNRDEQAKNRAAARKGAGYAARSKSRGYLP